MYSHLACQSFLYIRFARSLNSDMNLYKKIHYGLMNLIQVDFFMYKVMHGTYAGRITQPDWILFLHIQIYMKKRALAMPGVSKEPEGHKDQ